MNELEKYQKHLNKISRKFRKEQRHLGKDIKSPYANTKDIRYRKNVVDKLQRKQMRLTRNIRNEVNQIAAFV